MHTLAPALKTPCNSPAIPPRHHGGSVVDLHVPLPVPKPTAAHSPRRTKLLRHWCCPSVHAVTRVQNARRRNVMDAESVATRPSNRGGPRGGYSIWVPCCSDRSNWCRLPPFECGLKWCEKRRDPMHILLYALLAAMTLTLILPARMAKESAPLLQAATQRKPRRHWRRS